MKLFSKSNNFYIYRQDYVFYLFGIILSVLLAVIVSFLATQYMGVATCAYCFMVMGVLSRGHSKIHSKFMASAIILDFSTVLILEIKRNAIKTAMAFSLTPVQQTHILCSLIAILIYFPLVYLGVKGLKKQLSLNSRKWHMNLGMAAFIFRTAGFILMFSLLKNHH